MISLYYNLLHLIGQKWTTWPPPKPITAKGRKMTTFGIDQLWSFPVSSMKTVFCSQLYPECLQEFLLHKICLLNCMERPNSLFEWEDKWSWDGGRRSRDLHHCLSQSESCQPWIRGQWVVRRWGLSQYSWPTEPRDANYVFVTDEQIFFPGLSLNFLNKLFILK